MAVWFAPRALALSTVALLELVTGKMYVPRVLSADEDSLLQIILFGYALRKFENEPDVEVPRPSP
jgi:hypothetical protein